MPIPSPPRRILGIGLALGLAGQSEPAAPPSREDAYRANNRGVALLEQVKFAEGAEAFRQALKLDPSLDIAQVNLAIALFNVPELAAAQREAQAAVSRSAARPQAHYVAGLVAKAQNRPEDALAGFRRVLEIDGRDVGTNVNLAQVLMQQQKYAEAVARVRVASAAEPYNATAAYSLATALLRSGEQDEGKKEMERFQKLREAGYATSLSQSYPMQGRYAEALVSTGLEADLVDMTTPAVVFKAQGRIPPLPAMKEHLEAVPALTLFDGDGDGDVDTGGGSGVVGDTDNDGKPEILSLDKAGLTLLRTDAQAKPREVAAAAGLSSLPFAPRTAAFVDADHDGDLDLLVGGAPTGKSASIVLFRNNGSGKFTDVTAESKLAVAGTVIALVPTDFDNRRDVDLLVVREEGPLLFKNLRDGTFRDVAADAGLQVAGRLTSVTAGDVNKDTFTDFFFGREGGPGTWALSDGQERFRVTEAPAATAGAAGAQLLDYDNDGLLDLAVGGAQGLRVLRHLGDRWNDVTAAALAPSDASEAVRALAAGDVDGDGDTDLVVVGKADTRVLRNDGGERHASLRVALSGKTSNRHGVGAKVEARSGSLRHKLELYAALPPPAPPDLIFGLGSRTMVDAIRILWPSGTLQAETELPSVAVDPKATRRAAVRTVEELDRTPSSCPYLFAWNGERFAFVTDFMGGGEMGAWLAPGVRNRPDPEEYVRIRPDQLRARDGRYELRVTHELEEVLYVDRLELLAVDHPSGAAAYPNEGLTDPPRPFRLHVTRRVRPPLAAVDEHGHDVLARVRHLDGQAVDDFEVLPVRGYAAEHSLTLDVGETSASARLLLAGWTEYAFSSDNVAAHQAGLSVRPPALQVRDRDGRWTTAVTDLGFPVGRPQTVVVDLAGKLPPGTREVRVTTNMRVFWDQVAVDASGEDAPARTHHLPATGADLAWRGFSAATRHAGRTPIDFDYAAVSAAFPWKLMPGRYTRLGDVRPLLSETDDRFVVAHPGDEIALTFDAGSIPILPAGWTRTFLLHADGFSKEMNLHSASPDVVAPLPFHGMPSYPYEAGARAAGDLGDLERYHTREVTRPLPLLETALTTTAAASP